LLELRNVSAGYDTGVVLRDVNLVVPDNAVVALLGPNGAGKTTLLRVASGLLAPSSGQILVDGEDVTGLRPHGMAKRGVVHVPEGRGVFPSLTVDDNIQLQARPGAFRQALQTAADVFPKLAQRSKQVAGTMSGGEQQMLALHYAYVGEPRVVLLDEVSMGLAPKIVEEIFGYLQDLAQAGNALLLVEQYVKRALQMADYVYVLDRGQVTFAGEAGEMDEETMMNAYLGSLAS
jgi:branched-chain amino acid transport system ATP-binding protein